MEREYKIRISLDLQMFAKEGPGGEKTENATAKKWQDVRNEGNVAKSREVSTAASFSIIYKFESYYRFYRKTDDTVVF